MRCHHQGHVIAITREFFTGEVIEGRVIEGSITCTGKFCIDNEYANKFLDKKINK